MDVPVSSVKPSASWSSGPHVSWDDLMYEIYVRQAVERGIADADAGRVLSHDEAMSRRGLRKERR